MKAKTAKKVSVLLCVCSFLMFCWPGILLFDRPAPLVFGLPPMLWGTYLCVILCVILMLIVSKMGVEK